MTEGTTYTVMQRESEQRFVIEHEGLVAELTYRREPGQLRYTHTRVPRELEGRGIAGQLAKHALEYARSEGLRVIPQCPYVRAYVEKHPEYGDLVDG